MRQGEPLVSQFIYRLWIRASNNGDFLDSLLGKMSPKFKWLGATIGHLAFLCVHAAYVYYIPLRGQELKLSGIETIFWLWVLAYIVHEICEALEESSIIACASQALVGLAAMQSLSCVCLLLLGIRFPMSARCMLYVPDINGSGNAVDVVLSSTFTCAKNRCASSKLVYANFHLNSKVWAGLENHNCNNRSALCIGSHQIALCSDNVKSEAAC
eukprot:SAG11_NODE_3470_length_2429_cov_3.351073_4_plen_213_part_00